MSLGTGFEPTTFGFMNARPNHCATGQKGSTVSPLVYGFVRVDMNFKKSRTAWTRSRSNLNCSAIVSEPYGKDSLTERRLTDVVITVFPLQRENIPIAVI